MEEKKKWILCWAAKGGLDQKKNDVEGYCRRVLLMDTTEGTKHSFRYLTNFV